MILPNTVNWIIGNSYSAPLSVDAIGQIMSSSSLSFVPYMYLYPPGSTSYQAVSLTEEHGLGEFAYSEIPAKSIFMVRLSKGSNVSAGTSFTIGKEQLIHGNFSHNFLRSKTMNLSSDRDVSFMITLAGNPNVYDLSAVGLRSNASFGGDAYDIPKIYTAARESFQLYTLNSNNGKLSANGLPMETDSVLLNFKPQTGDTYYTLNVSQQGNEGRLWLKDLKTNGIIDLQQEPSYTFAATGTEEDNRFIVYFTEPKQATSISTENAGGDVFVKCSDNRLSIWGLNSVDINSKVCVYDMLGSMIFSGDISEYPYHEFNVNLPQNMYIISIQGQRNFNFKTVK
jgi:hypothetical protein